MMDEPLTVLAADDDGAVRELYGCWLGDHDLRLATDGWEAVEAFDRSVDVVLLGREMPGPSGVDLAERLGGDDTTCHVALVSSLPADVDLARVPVDQYVRKPTRRGDVEEVLETYRAKRAYLRAVDGYFAAAAKLGAIEAGDGGADRYEELRRRVAEKRATVDRLLCSSGPDWPVAFSSVPEPPAEDVDGETADDAPADEGQEQTGSKERNRRPTRA